MPDADLDAAVDALIGAAYGSAGERCMAISVAVAVGDESADALIERLAQRIAALKVGPGTIPASRWARWSPREHRDRVARLHRHRRQGRRDARRRRPRRSTPGTATGSSSAARSSTTSRPEMRDLSATRSSARCSASCASNDLEHAIELVNAHHYGNGVAIFTRDGGTARDVRPRSRKPGWSGSTCRSRCRWRSTASAAGRVALRRPCHARHGRRALLHAPEDRHVALALGRAGQGQRVRDAHALA